MAEEGRKREFMIESDEKSPVTLQDEPRYFSNIKPKQRTIVDVIYEKTGDFAQARTGKRVELIQKTTVYSDGVTVDTTVGEDNEGYQHFLATGNAIPSKGNTPTLVRPRSKAVEAALKKAAVALKKAAESEKKDAPKAEAKKEA